MANALVRTGGEFRPLTLPRGSIAAELHAVLPHSDVVGAFHHLPAKPLADLDRQLGVDVIVCGDDRPARSTVLGSLTTYRDCAASTRERSQAPAPSKR
jgi:predicted dinucleotide-binding enzyme